MRHSKILEETALWKEYNAKISSDFSDRKRVLWVEETYKMSVAYLKDVRRVFENYTLHDEVHILNVLDAMGGLLGDCIVNLTIGEIELLILAACLHDIGMVYTQDEMTLYFEDEDRYRQFLKETRPDLLGYKPYDWSDSLKQDYLRK